MDCIRAGPQQLLLAMLAGTGVVLGRSRLGPTRLAVGVATGLVARRGAPPAPERPPAAA